MGMSARLVSSKNGVYKIKTTLGNFTVNAQKGTGEKLNGKGRQKSLRYIGIGAAME